MSIFVSLDARPTASSHKLFSVLLIVGWIAACTAVVYFVYIFAWVGCAHKYMYEQYSIM